MLRRCRPRGALARPRCLHGRQLASLLCISTKTLSTLSLSLPLPSPALSKPAPAASINAAAAGAPSPPLFPCLQSSFAQAGNTFDFSGLRRRLHPISSLHRRCRCLAVAVGRRRGMPSAHVARRATGCSWPCRWPGAAMDKPGQPLSTATGSRWPSPAAPCSTIVRMKMKDACSNKGKGKDLARKL